MKRSSRTASRRFGFATDSASPTSPSKPSFDHISHVGQGEPHNTQNSPAPASRDDPDGDHSKTPIIPWMRRARRNSLAVTPTHQGSSIKDENHGDSPEKGGHSLRKRARVNYATEHIEEDLFAPSSTAPRSRKRKSYTFDETEDFSGPKAKRRNTSLSVDTPSSRRRNPARKTAEPKEARSFTSSTTFDNHFNDDNDIIRDTIEVGLSPSDMDLVDSDDLSSVNSSPSPKQEEDTQEKEAEPSHTQSNDLKKEASREATKEPEAKHTAIKETPIGVGGADTNAPDAKSTDVKSADAKFPDTKSTDVRPVYITTIKFNLAGRNEKEAERTATNAANMAVPKEQNTADAKENKPEDSEAKKPELKPDPGETEVDSVNTFETGTKETNVKEINASEAGVEESEAQDAGAEIIRPKEGDAEQAESEKAEHKVVELGEAKAKDAEPKEPAVKATLEQPEKAGEPKDNNGLPEQPRGVDSDMRNVDPTTVEKDLDAQNAKPISSSVVDADTGLNEAETGINETGSKLKDAEAETSKAESKDLEFQETRASRTEAQENQPKSVEVQETEPKTTEVGKTQPEESNAKDAESRDADVEGAASKDILMEDAHSQETGTQETGTQETGTQETGIQETGIQETGIQETGIQETVTPETKIQETETQEAETQEAEIQNTEIKDFEINHSEVKDAEVKNTKIEDIGIQDSRVDDPEAKTPEAKTCEAKSPEVKTPEAKSPEAKSPEVNDSEAKPSAVEDSEAKELGSKDNVLKETGCNEPNPIITSAIETSKPEKHDATSEVDDGQAKANEADVKQVESQDAEIASTGTEYSKVLEAVSHEVQVQETERSASSKTDALDNTVEMKDAEINEAGSSQEHQFPQEQSNDISIDKTQDDEESLDNQLQQAEAETQDHTVDSLDGLETTSPAEDYLQNPNTTMAPQTPTKEPGSQSQMLPSNSENNEELETPAPSTFDQGIVESPEDTTMASPPPTVDTVPDETAASSYDQDESVPTQQNVPEAADDNSTATSITTPIESNPPVDTVMTEPGEAEDDVFHPQPVPEQPKPTKSLESPSKKPIPAPVGRWSHLTPYLEGEYTSYPEKRERSEDYDGSEDPSQDISKEVNDTDLAVDENDEMPDVGTSELPTGALNTPTRGSPVPESLEIAASNSPAPANEDADDPEISESHEPLERALHFKYRKLRDADEFISVIENYETMKTEDLYEMLQAINVSLVEWQDEWSVLGKVVDDFENASRRRIADSKYESRTRNLNQHGINYEEPDFAVKGYKAKEREPMSETRYLQQQDRTMAAAYGFEYDPHPSKIGRQNPETQQAGVTTRGRALRNQPRQTAKATEADGVMGKRQRKPVQLFDPATQDISRSSTPVPTRGKRRRNAENDDTQSMPTSSFNEDGMSDIETTPNTRRRRGPRAKASSRFDGLSQGQQDHREDLPKGLGRRGRNKTYAPDEELERSRAYDDIDGQEEHKPRRHILTLKIPKGTTISDTASTIEDNGDLRPSTASSDSTSHTVESSYSFRPKRQKRFRDDPENGDEATQAPVKKRGRRSNVVDTRGDYVMGEASSAPSETMSNAGTGRKAPKIKVMRPTQESRNGTPTSQPTTEGGDDQPKEYRAMTKSEKMSASMKNRWANGNMAGAVEKRKATLAAKKAAQVAAEQKVGLIAPKQKGNKPSKKETALPGEGPAFVHSHQFSHIPPTQHGAQHQHVAPHPQTHPHDLAPMGIPFPSSR